jgi:repressor of nif and glnA expression
MDLPLKFVNYRIEDYALQVTYNPAEGEGRVIYNLSLVREGDFEYAVATLRDAFAAGLCVSDRVKFVNPGSKMGDFTIPEGNVGICTMCSITLDALLLKRGVPLNPIGGGVVEVADRIPRRFTHIIQYEHTTIDPLQVLISQEATSITGVMTAGSGAILANLRECHMEAESIVGETLDELTETGFTGILDVGVPNVPLLGIPVSPEYLGVALVGGTNPIAAFRESGRWAQTQALKGVMEFAEMGSILEY